MVHLTRPLGPAGYFKFPWLRWKKGFSIEWNRPAWAKKVDSMESHKEPYLALVDGGAAAEIYYPLEEAPGIAREFTQIVTAEAALAFANRYGWLGLINMPQFNTWIPARLTGGGENVNCWLTEAGRLKRAFHVWDLIASGDRLDRKSVV